MRQIWIFAILYVVTGTMDHHGQVTKGGQYLRKHACHESNEVSHPVSCGQNIPCDIGPLRVEKADREIEDLYFCNYYSSEQSSGDRTHDMLHRFACRVTSEEKSDTRQHRINYHETCAFGRCTKGPLHTTLHKMKVKFYLCSHDNTTSHLISKGNTLLASKGKHIHRNESRMVRHPDGSVSSSSDILMTSSKHRRGPLTKSFLFGKHHSPRTLFGGQKQNPLSKTLRKNNPQSSIAERNSIGAKGYLDYILASLLGQLALHNGKNTVQHSKQFPGAQQPNEKHHTESITKKKAIGDMIKNGNHNSLADFRKGLSHGLGSTYKGGNLNKGKGSSTNVNYPISRSHANPIGSAFGNLFGGSLGRGHGNTQGHQFRNPFGNLFGSPFGSLFGSPFGGYFGRPSGGTPLGITPAPHRGSLPDNQLGGLAKVPSGRHSGGFENPSESRHLDRMPSGDRVGQHPSTIQRTPSPISINGQADPAVSNNGQSGEPSSPSTVKDANPSESNISLDSSSKIKSGGGVGLHVADAQIMGQGKQGVSQGKGSSLEEMFSSWESPEIEDSHEKSVEFQYENDDYKETE